MRGGTMLFVRREAPFGAIASCVRSDSLAVVEDLHRAHRGADIDACPDECVMHAVESAVEVEVVVDVDADVGLPMGEFVAHGRKRAERRLFDTLERGTAAPFELLEGPFVELLEQLRDG